MYDTLFCNSGTKVLGVSNHSLIGFTLYWMSDTTLVAKNLRLDSHGLGGS